MAIASSAESLRISAARFWMNASSMASAGMRAVPSVLNSCVCGFSRAPNPRGEFVPRTGLLMLAVSWLGGYLLLRGGELPEYYLRALVGMTFMGCIATVAGWYVTEIGRQPWLVHGVLAVQDALGPVTGGMVLSTLSVYLGIYVFLAAAFVMTLFYMAGKAGHGGERDPEKQAMVGEERMTVLPAPD